MLYLYTVVCMFYLWWYFTYGGEYGAGEEQGRSERPVGVAGGVAQRRHASIIGVDDVSDELLQLFVCNTQLKASSIDRRVLTIVTHAHAH